MTLNAARDQRERHAMCLFLECSRSLENFQPGHPSRTQFNSSVSQNAVSMTHHRLRLMLSHVTRRKFRSNKNKSEVNNVLSMKDNSTWKLFCSLFFIVVRPPPPIALPTANSNRKSFEMWCKRKENCVHSFTSSYSLTYFRQKQQNFSFLLRFEAA